MNSTESARERALGIRTALWSALLGLHSLFLAAAFAVVFALKHGANIKTTVIAGAALLGILIVLFLFASAFAQIKEVFEPPTTCAGRYWAKERPKIWYWCELACIALFLLCAVILLLATVTGGG